MIPSGTWSGVLCGLFFLSGVTIGWLLGHLAGREDGRSEVQGQVMRIFDRKTDEPDQDRLRVR